MTNSKRILSLLLAFVMVFLVACGPKGGQKAKEEGKPFELTVAGKNSLASLDYVTTNKSADHQWNANFVETLLEYNNLGKLVGSLAESWETNKDSTVWTFKLKKDIKWVTNTQEDYGEVLTAEDFVTGLRHAAEFKSGTASLVQGVIKGFSEYMQSDFSDEAWSKVGIKAVDANTVQYTLEQSTPYFQDFATYSILMPINKSFLESKGDGCKLGKPAPKKCTFGTPSPESILYNGAFVLNSVTEKSSIVMVKNNSFYDADKVLLTKYTEIYDDGSDVYSIKKGFENGTYPSFALRPTWSDYKKVKEQYKDDAIKNLSNAVTFGMLFNFNRKSFKYTNYAKDAKLRENTRKAVLNENFRKAVRAAFDRKAQLSVAAPADLAEATLRNINNFKESGSTTDGKNYYELVNEVYNKNTGTKVDLSDGQDPFFGKEAALKYIEAAKKDGIEFPVHLDLLAIETDDTLVKKAKSLKQSIETNTDKQIIVEVILKSQDEVYGATYYNEDPEASDYDISTFSGWAPDYTDPKTFVQTFSYTEGHYQVGMGLGQGNKNIELKDKLGFTEYEKLYQEGNSLVDKKDQRLEAYAKADSLLIEKALFIPVQMQTRLESVTKVLPFHIGYSQVGLSNNKLKFMRVQDKVVTAEQYAKLKAEWEKAIKDSLKK